MGCIPRTLYPLCALHVRYDETFRESELNYCIKKIINTPAEDMPSVGVFLYFSKNIRWE